MARPPVVTGPVPRFIRSETIERIATEMRDLGGQAGGGYAVDVEQLAKAYDCDVRYVQFTPSTVSARVTKQSPPAMPFLIEVNASESPARRRFSIAHELAHVILHDDGGAFEFVEHRQPLTDYSSDSDLRKEVQANMLAAALLMPQALVTDFWRRNPDIDDLAARFGVSRDAAYWRVHNLRLLTDD